MNNPNALLYKWLVINSFAALLAYVAWLRGWLALVVESDASYLSVVIAIVFAVFWMTSSYHIWTVNREIAQFAAGAKDGIAAAYFAKLRDKSGRLGGERVDQSMLAATLRARMFMPIQVVNYVANILVLLGLIGTVVGFVIAVSGLGESLAGGSNIERVQGVLGQIVNGMGVALFTTLVGSILGGLWLQIHYQMLARAVGGLVIDIIERADIEVIPGLARADAESVAAARKAAAE
ncbi:MAG TPA: MotA/TolQ/ExbB proton channel family protein [Kiloniellales bacterium]